MSNNDGAPDTSPPLLDKMVVLPTAQVVDNPVLTITGIVTSTGSITAGSGFGVVHTSTGVFTITFSKPFLARPVILVTVTAAANPQISLTSPSTTGFVLNINNIAGSPNDQPFNFIAQTVV